ncbi:chorismate mutase [Caminicella sporogenes]|nr:chorismate mutase [Caminicella sporogenes]RKD26403.1 chorismate mutase [Caminicella sporogenes]
MKDLQEMRKRIDEIDKELVKLFEKRLYVIFEINEYKKKHLLPIEDKNRERELIKTNVSYCKNPEYSTYIVEFLECIISISKKVQLDYRKIKND